MDIFYRIPTFACLGYLGPHLLHLFQNHVAVSKKLRISADYQVPTYSKGMSSIWESKSGMSYLKKNNRYRKGLRKEKVHNIKSSK